jgi:hypothetical protein
MPVLGRKHLRVLLTEGSACIGANAFISGKGVVIAAEVLEDAGLIESTH